MSTIFSKIINKEIPAKIVYEDDEIIAFEDIEPKAPVHILIIPKKEIKTLNDIDKQDATLIGRLIIVAKKIASDNKIEKDGSLVPFVPLENFNFKVDSNRQKQDTVYFHDCGASVIRPKCLENISEGLLPQPWMGKKIYPLIQEGVLDVDLPYELPLVENWLKTNNFTKDTLPYKLKIKK